MLIRVGIGAHEILTDTGQLSEDLDQCAQKQTLTPLRNLEIWRLMLILIAKVRLITLNMTAQPGAVIAFSAESVALISLYSVWIHSSLEPS